MSIKIGTGYLQKLQQLLLYILTGRTKEDMEEYKKHATSTPQEKDLPEDWMNHVRTVSALISNIEQEAESSKQTVDAPDEPATPQGS